MSQYNNIFISREDFLDYKTKGIPYTGFVIGEGYALCNIRIITRIQMEQS